MKINFRSGRPAIPDMLDCLTSVYGQKHNYVNPKMFDAADMETHLLKGVMTPFSGVTKDDEAAVCGAVRKAPRFPKAGEICTVAVHEKCRGFHLSNAIISHILENAPDSLFHAKVVMFMPLAGQNFEDYGFIPTGFLFGVCDAGKHLAELGLTSQKHTWAVYVRNNGQSEVGMLYVPEHLREFVLDRYTALGITPVFGESTINKTSQLEYEQDDYHNTMYIYVTGSGEDLAESITLAEARHTAPLQTVILFLNMNDSGAEYGYNILTSLGYAFAGIKPLCGEFEYLLLYKVNEVYLDKTEFKMTAALSCLHERISEAK
jgi:hypothetical protein